MLPDHSTSIAELRTSLRRLEQTSRFAAQEKERVSTGVPALDAILPDHGLLRGTLSEWIGSEAGSGALSLAMRVAGQTQHDGAKSRALIIVDRNRRLYPPAFPATGVQLEHTILVRPTSHADELWALEQSLRCPGVGAVLCRIDHLKTQQFRRLQLAAESGTAIGLLIRSATACKQSGWADVRLLVTARPTDADLSPFHRRLEVRCLYAKGSLGDQTVELELCDETGVPRERSA